MVTRARVALAGGLVVLLVAAAFLVLRDDPTSSPTRLRERIVLSEDVVSELTGATVSMHDGDPMVVDVAVDDRTICLFETRRPKNHFATIGGDTWVVIVRRVDTDLRAVDVRVDHVPDSGEVDGCRTEGQGGS